MTVPGLTVVAVPHRFQAGQSSTSGVEPELMFMATAPPRLEPTTTSGWFRSNSAWAVRTALSKSSSDKAGFSTSWPWSLRKVGLMPPGVDCQPWRKGLHGASFDVNVARNALGEVLPGA